MTDQARAKFNKKIYNLINSTTEQLETELITTHMPNLRQQDIGNYSRYVKCLETNLNNPSAQKTCQSCFKVDGLNLDKLQQSKDNLMKCVNATYQKVLKFDDFEFKKFELCTNQFKKDASKSFF